MPQLSHFLRLCFSTSWEKLKVIKVGKKAPVMLSYCFDYSPNLYATIVYRCATSTVPFSSSSPHSFPMYCVIPLNFISPNKFQTFIPSFHTTCTYCDVDVWVHFDQLWSLHSKRFWIILRRVRDILYCVFGQPPKCKLLAKSFKYENSQQSALFCVSLRSELFKLGSGDETVN